MPWLTGQRGSFLKDMSEWRKEGWLKHSETVFEGLEAWPAAFASLFTGTNNGKVVVKV
jgi:NADPH-dependent curcumin reductase CurA